MLLVVLMFSSSVAAVLAAMVELVALVVAAAEAVDIPQLLEMFLSLLIQVMLSL